MTTCAELIDGGAATAAWVVLGSALAVSIGIRMSRDARVAGFTPANVVMTIVVMLGGAAAFAYIAVAPNDRCDDIFLSLLFTLVPVAILSSVLTAVILLRRH